MYSNRRRLRHARRFIWGGGAAAAALAVMLAVPAMVVTHFEPNAPSPVAFRQTTGAEEGEAAPEDRPLLVPVYMTKQGTTVAVPLEDYVRGVLAAEMPAEFDMEALKAQAIAARTYLIRRLELQEPPDVPPEAQGAIVTDTVRHQAYVSAEALRERWGWFAYARNMDKLTRAVNETKGLIVTYEGKPIEAVFFSASNGFTESSEYYWQEALPYLRGVASPWDRRYAPELERHTELSFQDLYEKLGLPASDAAPVISVKARSPGGRVLRISVGGVLFSGRDFRERLGLASTDFTWTTSGERIVIATVGSGHGVGMSQWGANGMAKEGMTAEQILEHYYSGVRIEPWNTGDPL